MIQIVNGATVMVKVLRWPDFDAVLAAELHGRPLQIEIAAYYDGCETAAPLHLTSIRRTRINGDGSVSFVGDYVCVDVAAGGTSDYLTVESVLCRVVIDASGQGASLEYRVQLDAWESA